jgi:23S rRNA-/tRNA-specific pseudouridylate synthase
MKNTKEILKMKHYYIQLKKGLKMTLLDAVKKHLKISIDESRKLIYQGSVWNSARNKRLKDEKMTISSELVIINYPEYPIIEYELKKEKIIFEDEHLMIINKEAGLNTCQTPLSDIDCLVHGVQKYLDSINVVYTVFAINRLDKPTSGLVFFAKNKNVEIELHKCFHEHRIRKLYLAITPVFELSKQEFLIQDKLEWKGKQSDAATYIKFNKEKDGKYYFIVYPLTGRTHQIRKHFQKYLIPIIGDALYGKYSRDDEMNLICFKYRFVHPVTGKKMDIEYLDEKYRC